MAISQSINTFPEPLPNRKTDSRAELSDHVDNFFGHINTHVEENNAWAGQANALANDVNADASDAKTYRDEAQASQNAIPYEHDETYNKYKTVIGSNGHAYRCIIDGTSGDNPVGSSTGHWAQITVGSTEIFEDQVKTMQFRSFGYSLMF